MNALLLSLVIATAGNANGGKIMLTDIKCDNSGFPLVALSAGSNGEYIRGCWYAEQEFVYVVWDEIGKGKPELRIYDSGQFQLTNKPD